jgi:hypothetical protein
VARERKEAESVARFKATEVKPKAAPEVKVKVPCDRSAAAKKAWATSRDKIIAGIKKAMAARKASE